MLRFTLYLANQCGDKFGKKINSDNVEQALVIFLCQYMSPVLGSDNLMHMTSLQQFEKDLPLPLLAAKLWLAAEL